MPKNKVLIPLDGSPFSLQILPYVQRFLNATENELILLYCSKRGTLNGRYDSPNLRHHK